MFVSAAESPIYVATRKAQLQLRLDRLEAILNDYRDEAQHLESVGAYGQARHAWAMHDNLSDTWSDYQAELRHY